MSINSGFSEESLRRIASQKISYRVSVKLHIVIFITVNILLYLVNIFSTPGLYWIIYPFFSWLIGINMHAIGYLLYARGVYPMAKRGVIFHIVSFVSVMLFLFIINFTTLSEYYWVVFPSIFWGTGVILHILIYIHYYSGKVEKNGKYSSRKERAIEKELEKMRKKQKKNN
ncbi:MAG: 2TM domain-containing protein [Candidatus Lokiarchaeota archaeon]|nr:2TM domain-containing protein [Candidatus Lokiarchaeota archaeon]